MSSTPHLQRSATAMRVAGLAILVGLPLSMLAYPAGFLWGAHPDWPVFLSHHPASDYAGLHPYLFMVAAMYLALGLLLLKGASDPLGNKALFDYAILSSVLHGGVMLVQSFVVRHELAHLWADVPALFALAGVMWYWHPSRSA